MAPEAAAASEFDWEASRRKAKRSGAGGGVGGAGKKNEQAFRGFSIQGQTGPVPETRKRKKADKNGGIGNDRQKRRKGPSDIDLSTEHAEAMSAVLKFGAGRSS